MIYTLLSKLRQIKRSEFNCLRELKNQVEDVEDSSHLTNDLER